MLNSALRSHGSAIWLVTDDDLVVLPPIPELTEVPTSPFSDLPTEQQERRGTRPIVVGSIVGGLALIAIIWLLFCCYRRYIILDDDESGDDESDDDESEKAEFGGTGGTQGIEGNVFRDVDNGQYQRIGDPVVRGEEAGSSSSSSSDAARVAELDNLEDVDDWEGVVFAGAKYEAGEAQYKGSSKSESASNTSSSMDAERAAELDNLVGADDWEGVVSAAVKYEEADSSSND